MLQLRRIARGDLKLGSAIFVLSMRVVVVVWKSIRWRDASATIVRDVLLFAGNVSPRAAAVRSRPGVNILEWLPLASVRGCPLLKTWQRKRLCELRITTIESDSMPHCGVIKTATKTTTTRTIRRSRRVVDARAFSVGNYPDWLVRRCSCGVAIWLILPVVICLSQRLSHACLSISTRTVKLRMAH